MPDELLLRDRRWPGTPAHDISNVKVEGRVESAAGVLGCMPRRAALQLPAVRILQAETRDPADDLWMPCQGIEPARDVADLVSLAECFRRGLRTVRPLHHYSEDHARSAPAASSGTAPAG